MAYDVEHTGELNRARFTEAFLAAGALPSMQPWAGCTAVTWPDGFATVC